MAKAAGPARSGLSSASLAFNPTKFEGMSYDHNGSIVRVNEKIGAICYEMPKKAKAETVRSGKLLFKGTFQEIAKPGESARGTIEGTAYVCKK